MYRNTAQNYGHVKYVPPNALPSPDNTSDSDLEILDALDEKRRQLDEEIARFKVAKEREFREFERELRVKRKGTRIGGHLPSEPTSIKQFTSAPSTTASALNLLASAQNGSPIGRAGPKARRDGYLADKVKRPAPLSGPTLSIEKLNITGETTPPLHTLGTPPTPSLLMRTRSRSPTDPAARPTTPPFLQGEKESTPMSTPAPSRDRSDPFAGVFTPAYLPLLESRDRTALIRSPQISKSADEENKRLQLDASSKLQAERQRLESSQSLPPQQVSPTIVTTKRTKSSPVLPSASLPSALRTASGGGRRRKHVMFQLADLKVVDPSSSYEEGPSPEMEEKQDVMDYRGPGMQSDHGSDAGKQYKGSPRLPVEKEKRQGRGRNGRFVSPIPSPLASPSPSSSPSPALHGSSPHLSPVESPSLVPSSVDETTGFSGGLAGADDGGSGVGFFELDEELASPALREGKPVETFDLDVEEEGVNENAAGATRHGLGIIPSVQVGSVPIDIVRPSSSFIGSYGH
ncbi:hypothetical protein A1O7_00390 [Cladophialophora yegresii CBS 114405]|uniref:Uncharacterized protein n=1 Tax=Cladophialophora yegresii CBS 114405 TaxID=1182544 RepID=W9WGD5_9EURO|nr:uncharacterized protein A1O7_00390 [Cladophialophora yegresii CBS 114405]EXJ64055.1 hypothetical protein A1O7_00390 [Cladophialophora yegresii CBS 114405]